MSGGLTSPRPDHGRPPAPRLEPTAVAAASLVCLPEMTPARLARLLDHFGGARRALAAVGRGEGAAAFAEGRESPDERRARAARWALAVADGRIPALLARRRTRVHVAGGPDDVLPDGPPDRPRVLLAEGERPDALAAPRVAVVGTRAATPHGLADAREIGAVLAEAKVTVVSGLAIGIDAAAHVGALDAGGRVVGVLGTGLDVVYPRRHGALFERVRDAGLLMSELAYGAQPRPAAFPPRNRIIAALADVVVVVEATLTGGARITAERAVEYGRPVLAVPGSRRNPAAAGTNALIADGAHPLLEPGDVLLALGLQAASRRHDDRQPPVGDAALVWRAMGGEPATLDDLAVRSTLGADRLSVALRALERDGWIERTRGMWWPR